MDSSLRKRKFYLLLDNNENNSASSSSISPPQSSLSPSSSLNRIWAHHVFPSFRGEDVRRDFLSHILAEFQRKGITPFIDNKIKRGESIGPELIRAIRGSKIAIILLSRNYASSSWCLDELAETMKCRKELGQTVMVVFYKVDPSDVKKVNGDFGEVFRKTCAGKSKEDIGRWTQALAEVATIAGYHSNNWDNEAAMINKIATDISNKLNHSLPSRDFDGFVGMRAHLEKMINLLCLDSDEVKRVGIWGPSGIGKTTIARAVYNELCNWFQMSVFMESIEGKYTRPCSDDYSAKLRLQQLFMSKITNEKDMEVSHLGVVEDRLKDKKVLVVLDGVDQSMQLDAMAKETWWFGPGSRIIITTQNQKLFREHRINQIYEVDFPPDDEALQILCMYAFGQKSPKDGFEELAGKVTDLADNLPLGLRVMGSYLRGMSKQEWTKAITRLRASLDTNIQSILKLSYDALDDEDKNLFLHIACFFNGEEVEKVEAYLEDSFLDVRHGIDVLNEKSLISIDEWGYIRMHNLLAQLGKDIVRKQHIREPGQRLFLTESREISKVLKDDASGNKSVIGIHVDFDSIEEILHIKKRAFEGMNNLQFLRFSGYSEEILQLPRNLQLLEWRYFPMTCLPSTFKTDFLVTLDMRYSKLEKLWEGNKPLGNLKWMDLRFSRKLTELPDLSTATSLQDLNLSYCTSLISLPSIGNAINLQVLDLCDCSYLVDLSSIGNATNLQKLDLSRCKSLISLPSSIGNATNLQKLDLSYCSSLISLPSSIENATNLQELNLSDCSSLIRLPSSIGNATNLKKLDLSRCKSLISLPSSIGNAINLQELDLSDCSCLVDLPSIGNAINLQELDLSDCSCLVDLPSIGNATNLQKLNLFHCSSLISLPSSIGNAINLQELNLSGCSCFVDLPSSIGNATSLEKFNLSYCASLVEIPFSIGNLHKLQSLDLRGCSKLEVLPTNINLESLDTLDLTDCLLLERFPEISTNISVLKLEGTAIKEIPSSIKSWSRLDELELRRCRKLVSVPQIPSSISFIDASKCESLDRLFQNSNRSLRFDNCFNLNQEAKDLIIQAPSRLTVLPGGEVPAYFTHRASGGSLTIKLNEMLLPTSMTFKACVLLVYEGDDEADDYDEGEFCTVTCKSTQQFIYPPLSGHMYMFNVEADVTSNEVVFDFETERSSWKIGECGVVYGEVLETVTNSRLGDTIKQAKVKRVQDQF